MQFLQQTSLMIARAALTISALTISALAFWPNRFAAADGAMNPETLLTNKGLTPVGKVWTTRLELDFREHLEQLDGQEKRALQAQKRFDAAIEKNESARTALVNAVTHQSLLQSAIATASGANKSQLQAELKQLNAQIDQLKPQYVDAKTLAELPAAKSLVVDLNNARNELALNVFWLQARAEPLAAATHALADDPQVVRAATTLGMQLAPVKSGYLESSRMARVEPICRSERNYVYRESGFYRLCALANRSLPVTFSYRESSDPLVLPASVAQNLGLKFDASKTHVFMASDKRKLAVSSVTLAELRIGKFIWKDVEAIVLPPEAEDLGAQLSPNSLSGHRVTIDANLLRLKIEPK